MTEISALQTALAAEHAVVHVYGVLGGQTSQAAQPDLFAALQAAYALHRAHRDLLTAELRDLAAEPVPAEPAYEVPGDLTTPDAVRAHARELEAGCASTYVFVVGSTTGRLRRWAVGALTDAAVRGLGFGAEPQAFPGR